MSKKKLSALFSLASLFLISGSLVGCGASTEPPVSDKESGNPTGKPTEKPTEPSKETKPSTHECVFYKVDAKEATCVSKGNIEYEQCPYCKKIMVDGKAATEESVILPIDPNNHVHLTDIPGKEPTCLESGIKAHQHCEDCEKDLINGQEVTENDYTIQASDEYHQLVSVEGSLPDCGHTGVKAHQKCDICHKVFVDGAEVTPESLILPIDDSHTYDEQIYS